VQGGDVGGERAESLFVDDALIGRRLDLIERKRGREGSTKGKRGGACRTTAVRFCGLLSCCLLAGHKGVSFPLRVVSHTVGTRRTLTIRCLTSMRARRLLCHVARVESLRHYFVVKDSGGRELFARSARSLASSSSSSRIIVCPSVRPSRGFSPEAPTAERLGVKPRGPTEVGW
jgi:hypothetical protein